MIRFFAQSCAIITIVVIFAKIGKILLHKILHKIKIILCNLCSSHYCCVIIANIGKKSTAQDYFGLFVDIIMLI